MRDNCKLMRLIFPCIVVLVCLLSVSSDAKSLQAVINLDNDVQSGKVARNLRAVVGDSTKPEFESVLRLTAWEEDCFLEIDFNPSGQSEAPYANIEQVNNAEAVSGVCGNMEYAIYRRGDGNLEWELILLTAPADSSFTFNIKAKNLNFYYQDIICREPGCIRPDSVKGSYAVYHSAYRNNIIVNGRMHSYKTGKAFHIYRPKIHDALGITEWGGIEIDTLAGEMRLYCPRSFLDSAVYPVVIDPTFGYDISGGSSTGLLAARANINDTETYVASSGDRVISYHIFAVDVDGDADQAGMALYNMSSGLPDNRVFGVVDITIDDFDPPASWLVSPAVSHDLTAGVLYCVAMGNAVGDIRVSYDSRAETSRSFHNAATLDQVWSSHSTRGVYYSMYVTYEENAGGEVISVRRRRIMDMIH